MNGRYAAARAVLDLRGGEDPEEEPLAVPFDDVGDPIDVRCVETQADDVWHD
jgi:hypothetical protein